ncbi:TlpA disulfide reductase family protein [Flavobacteriaceae bacterium KMM 6897]|nr:TlpA disulfide reductase family protein [Flavobacteriaceae bacterium KMM 6897]MEB8345332.1 TlpA disulfide reductase family protein [Flavobacteriaceae bacterium KMM 6898]
MRKIIVSLCAFSAIVACNNNPEGFNLDGTVTGELENGTKVYLKMANPQNQLVDVDTTTVENGKFTFSGSADVPEIHYVYIDQLRGNIPFIVEKGEIELTVQKDSLNNAQISGTPQNEFFSDFIKGSKALSSRANSINEDMRKASAKNDEANMVSLRDEYFELQEEAKNFELEYVKKNPNSLISVLIIDKVLNTKSMTDDEVKVLFDGLSPEMKGTKPGKSIEEKLNNKKSSSIGSKAPNFSAPTPSGEKLALNDAMGKVTIVDFWAAWCKPCRAENPNVVKVYNQYHEKGLNIIGVSLDRKAEDWKKAIADDGLVWNHVSNVEYFDEIAKLYNVDAIPATFILDENGVIVAKNLRGPALEQKIAEMLQ